MCMCVNKKKARVNKGRQVAGSAVVVERKVVEGNPTKCKEKGMQKNVVCR